MRLRDINLSKTLALVDITDLANRIWPSHRKIKMPLVVRVNNVNYPVTEVGTQTTADGNQYFVIRA